MNILDICNKELICLNLEVKNKEDAIMKMAECIYKNGYVNDVEKYVKNVLDREEELTTGFGDGLAMPHGKASCVTKAALMIARFTEPIEWGSLDNKPVDIAFLLAIPEENEEDGNIHLKMLTSIASKLGSTKSVAEMRKLETKDKILDFLSK